MFHNVFDYYAEFPDAPRVSDDAYCAPRIEDGFELEAARQVLAARGHRLRPDGTAAPAAELRGNFERVTRTMIEGWAFDPETPDQPARLVILDGGVVIGRVTARDYRPDLEAAGIGDGFHAFRFLIPNGFWTETRHEIEIRRESDWTLLYGSGKVLEAEITAAAA
jgi:hypothetical protein